MSDSIETLGGNSQAELRALIERIERVNDEIKELTADRKDIFAEAKARGFDPRAMRAVIAAKKLERQVFEERRALEDTYLSAAGLLDR